MLNEYRNRFAETITFVESSLSKFITTTPESHRYLLERGLGIGEFAEAGRNSKRLRGTIAALIHSASPSPSSSREIVSAIPELIHAASLIVDDIQDNHHSRWGTQSLWLAETPAMAINTSFMILALVQALSMKLSGYCSRDFVNTVMAMLEGQAQDILAHNLYPNGFAGYKKIVIGKTGKLLSFATRIGGEAFPLKTQESLSEWAMNTGIAHQLLDDIDDFTDNDIKQLPSSNVWWFIEDNHKNANSLKTAIPVIQGIAKKYIDRSIQALGKTEIPQSLHEDLCFLSKAITARINLNQWSLSPELVSDY